jgi:hypothetical protein
MQPAHLPALRAPAEALATVRAPLPPVAVPCEGDRACAVTARWGEGEGGERRQDLELSGVEGRKTWSPCCPVGDLRRCAEIPFDAQ